MVAGVMNKIVLPIDIKSLYFNIKNDNESGHTATVATPIKKHDGNNKLEDIFLIKDHVVDISDKSDLIQLLVKHSKSKVLIKQLFVFKKISVNGRLVKTNYSFGCYIKEEIDESKVQFGRQKLHYPSKMIYEDEELNINNKQIYKEISKLLNDYAFLITSFEYYPETGILNFDALIVGENNIPYSKVFITEKGHGNKFNNIFNEEADDYDSEIMAMRKFYGAEVNPHNYLDVLKSVKKESIELINKNLDNSLVLISDIYPYSLFDFYYFEGEIKKYGILRVTLTKNKYFNLSFIQQIFIMKNAEDAKIFLISNAIENPAISIFCYEDLANLSMTINSIKYEEK